MAGDAFEESEMHDGSPVVRRDKLVSRRMAALFFGSGVLPMVVAVFLALTNGASDKPLSSSSLPVVCALLALYGVAMVIGGIVFGVLRTVVTKKAVHVRYGLWGPTIPLDAVESARVVVYDWTEFGGWGMRIGKGGARAYVPKNGPCVELVYREGDKKKRVLVGAEDASATVAAIEEARGRVRVAEDARADVADIADEEEDALASERRAAR